MAFQEAIIYRSTSGVLINLETYQDLSIFSNLQASIQAPDSTVSTVITTINATKNTQMEFLSDTTTFPVAGIYKIQSIADGIRGETAVVNVKELFE